MSKKICADLLGLPFLLCEWQSLLCHALVNRNRGKCLCSAVMQLDGLLVARFLVISLYQSAKTSITI
jgi:hypothetical protein